MKQRLTLSMCILAAASALNAQTDDQYRMEIGAGVGLMSYQGDFNGSIMKNQQPMASLVLRRIWSPYMGLKFSGSYGKLKGTSKDVKTYYPELKDNPYEFSRSLVDVSAVYEYNFWPYGTGRDYRGAKRLTPFVFVGVGATFASGGDADNCFTANMPIGLGVKYKIGSRLNLGVEWAEHFSLSDNLDGKKDPYGIESTGLFKNTDCYSTLQITLTYSFSAKCRTCHNEDE
uniref:type IX secretion system protein PorG n=1 Tax=Prevotella sp. TaxID=59823 RepID=UPI0040259751